MLKRKCAKYDFSCIYLKGNTVSADFSTDYLVKIFYYTFEQKKRLVFVFADYRALE